MQVRDATGYDVELAHTPVRIVSLVPSQTEFLADLGLSNQLVGITRFCIHPKSVFTRTTKVGGTKQPHIEKIKALAPDLIVANKEENEKEVVEALRTFCPVWVSDVRSLEQSLDMMQSLGDILEKGKEAQRWVQQVAEGFDSLVPMSRPFRVVYLIWRNPFMAVSGDTFIGDMLQRLGLINVLAHANERYPVLTLEDLRVLDPDLILLSSEPYPFRMTHGEELQQVCPRAKVMTVDGEMFSWYGSRLVQSVPYFQTLLSTWQR
jgi:ABC-type Fe3+-hydroxamate transport system substrate-binding protein